MISILETELINALSVRKVNKSDDWIKAKNQYFQETDSFRKKFTTKKIANLSLHDYAPGNKNKNSFCFHIRSEEHTSELQSRENLVCRLLLEKKKNYRCEQ